jgi:hypothetical protein
MILPNYEEHEEELLKASCDRFGFSGKTWLVFLERFREKNTDSLDKDIAAYLETELIEGTSDGANPATILPLLNHNPIASPNCKPNITNCSSS